MYKQPVPVTRKLKRLKTITPARMKTVDTGRKHVFEIIKENGEKVSEERKITEQVFIPAGQEEVEVSKTFQGVENIKTGEIHEFATKTEALRFIRESS